MASVTLGGQTLLERLKKGATSGRATHALIFAFTSTEHSGSRLHLYIDS